MLDGNERADERNEAGRNVFPQRARSTEVGAS
jgi:hypothetical protein